MWFFQYDQEIHFQQYLIFWGNFTKLLECTCTDETQVKFVFTIFHRWWYSALCICLQYWGWPSLLCNTYGSSIFSRIITSIGNKKISKVLHHKLWWMLICPLSLQVQKLLVVLFCTSKPEKCNIWYLNLSQKKSNILDQSLTVDGHLWKRSSFEIFCKDITAVLSKSFNIFILYTEVMEK